MAASFDRVLNEKLAEVSAAERHCGASRGTLPFRTAPDPGVLFALWSGGVCPPTGSSAFLNGRGYCASRSSDSGRPAESARPAASPRAPRRPHRFTPPAQAAFDELRRVGAAGLDRGFTHDELRREFRSLALRYHPDRHPQAGALERRQLAATFARVAAAYRELLAVVEPAA